MRAGGGRFDGPRPLFKVLIAVQAALEPENPQIPSLTRPNCLKIHSDLAFRIAHCSVPRALCNAKRRGFDRGLL